MKMTMLCRMGAAGALIGVGGALLSLAYGHWWIGVVFAFTLALTWPWWSE